MKTLIKCIVIILCAIMPITCTRSTREVLPDGRVVYKGGEEISDKESMTGRIVDYKTGDGISNATVEIKNANLGIGYYKVTTDSDGKFQIEDYLKRVQYEIAVVARGYIPHKGSFYGPRTFRLKKEAVLKGLVSDSSENPLSGVEVSIKGNYGYRRSSGDIRVATAKVTNAKGFYRFNQLKGGSYTVKFNRKGYITETARLGSVLSGGTVALPMVLYKTSDVSGKIIIKDTKSPAININVSLKGGKRGESYAAATFPDGTYIIEDVRPGKYMVRVSHAGFQDIKKGPITIVEGKKKKNMNFTVTAKEPALSIYSYRYTFSPINKVRFNMRTFRLEKVKIRIYRVPMEVLVRGRSDPNSIDFSKNRFKLERQWDESVKDFSPYDWQYQTIAVHKALPTGGYCIEVGGPGKIRDRKFFTVTSVGVIVKRSRNSIFTYVSSLVKNKPVAGARVLVFDNTPPEKRKKSDGNSNYNVQESPVSSVSSSNRNPGLYESSQRIEKLPLKIVHRGKTNAKGVYHHKIRTDKHLAVLVIAPDSSYGYCNSGSPRAFTSEQNRFLIYTERPVYRAGNKVFFKIIAKERKAHAAVLANKKVYYQVRDPERNIVKRGTFILDNWGTANSVINLRKDTKLGRYEIKVGLTPEYYFGTGRFYVEQYRKPEFNIEIDPSKDFYVNNETAVFKVTAKYLFGAPLRNAVVKYRFYESRLKDANTTYWWESQYRKRKSYNRIKLEGQKIADENGITVLKVDCKNYPYDREITLEATVTDDSNISITSRRKVRVGRGAYYIKIMPSSNFYINKQVNKVVLKTIQQDGDAVSRKVNVKIYRYIWRPLQMVYVHEKRPLYNRNVTTNRKGSYVLNLPDMPRGGEYDIVVNGTDRFSNKITASRVVWVYSSSGTRVTSRLKNLELSIDRTKLTRPGYVTCLVKSRFPNTFVCLTLEGRDIYDSKILKLKGNMGTVKFLIKDSYAPNLYVSAVMQRNRALYTARGDIAIPKRDTRLMITLEPDKKKYLPGEKATVRITTRDERGNPVNADVSLGCVDEAIYLIRADHTVRLLEFFYTRISNWVLTSYSYPMTLLAGAIKNAIMQIRERFEDTAFWQANVRTGSDGVASISFELPDNLTTWRLTARGHDKQGRVGEKRKKFLVTQDLVARIGKPRFLIEKDSISIIGIVNSNAKRGLPKVETLMKLNGKKLSPDEKIAISLPPFGSARNYYTFTVPEDKKKISILYKAAADSAAKDGLRIYLPIQSRGAPYSFYGVGDLAGSNKVKLEPLGDTDDFSYKPSSLKITVNPGPVERMLRAAEYLRKYRYGCVEQILSKTVPVAVFKKLLQQKGMAHLLKDRKIDTKVKRTFRRLSRAQNSDGSWGWFPSGRSNLWITAYVLQNMKIAENAGFKVDNGAVFKGLRALKRGIVNTYSSPDAVAYYSYVYAMWGRYDSSSFSRLLERKETNPYQLAFLIRTLAQLKKNKRIEKNFYKEKSAEKIGALKKLLQKDSMGIYWKSVGRQRYGWQGGNNEVSAYVLSALVESGDTSPIPSQLAQSLVKRGYGDGWLSTKETAAVMFSLCSYLQETKTAISSKGSVRFKLNGSFIAEIPYDTKAPKLYGSLTKTIAIDPSMYKGKYIVEAEGTGSSIGFDCVMDGNLYFKDKGFLSFFRSRESSLKDLENGISLVRSYHSILRVRDINNREYMVPQRMTENKVIKVGDEILVTIRFKAMDTFSYCMLEDYLPAGFEVIKKDAYESPSKNYTHLERWDNRMIFFYPKVAKGRVYDVAYILRAELPGRFMAKPSRMECMYEPSIQGWSKAARFEVKKK